MKGLLVKDKYLIAQRKQTLLLFLAICIILGFSTDGSFIVGYMSFFSAILAVSTISYDEADNGMMFLMTMPIERKTYAYSKYIFGAICGGISWLIAVLLMFVLNAVKNLPINLMENILAAMAFLPVTVLALDLMIPVQLKYGAEKSRTVMLVVFGGLTAVILLAAKALNGTAAGNTLITAIDKVPDAVYVAAAVLICAALTFVSVRISRRIMENKIY